MVKHWVRFLATPAQRKEREMKKEDLKKEMKKVFKELDKFFGKDKDARIERSLVLPTGKISNLRKGEGVTHADVALLKIIMAYPFILSVADSLFDPAISKYHVGAEFGRLLGETFYKDEKEKQKKKK